MPELSVVVNILLGREFTDRCIAALLNQEEAPTLEIVVPVCPEFDDAERLRRKWPGIRLPAVSGLPPSANLSHPGLAHLIYDRRRAAGMAAATGDIVALTEDQMIPDPDWCASLVRAHRAASHAAIGGAVENGGAGVLHRALYLCDFGRYRRTSSGRYAVQLTDQNVSYKRAALEKIRDLWSGTYHEPAVHDALRAAGGTLWFAPECIVRMDRGGLSLAQQLRERYSWGRVFGGTRARRTSAGNRAALLLLSPLLPALILWRLLKGGATLEAVTALPVLIPMASSWALGEAAGYATARPFPVSE